MRKAQITAIAVKATSLRTAREGLKGKGRRPL